MFKAFLRTIPQVSIFHNPASPTSLKALKLLQSAVASPYPSSKLSAPPLQFDLEVIENKPPTPDQLRTILSYLPSKPSSPDVLLSAHLTVDARPTNAEEVSQLASQNLHALKWPIVVDWNNGNTAVGDIDGVKNILEELRKKRDGEV
ncbi:thioredoxin-like protein [Trametes maxima]|nr:thioredoxin-like protein [Trametes maxima]